MLAISKPSLYPTAHIPILFVSCLAIWKFLKNMQIVKRKQIKTLACPVLYDVFCSLLNQEMLKKGSNVLLRLGSTLARSNFCEPSWDSSGLSCSWARMQSYNWIMLPRPPSARWNKASQNARKLQCHWSDSPTSSCLKSFRQLFCQLTLVEVRCVIAGVLKEMQRVAQCNPQKNQDERFNDSDPEQSCVHSSADIRRRKVNVSKSIADTQDVDEKV